MLATDMMAHITPKFIKWPQAVIILILYLSFIAAEVHAVEKIPRLAAAFHPEKARVGSIVRLVLTYKLPKDARLPEPAVIRGLEELTLIEQQVKRGKIELKLLVDQLDILKTGPLSIDYLDAVKEIKRLTTDSVSLAVLSNLGENPDRAEIKPIQDIVPGNPFFLKAFFWFFMAVCLAIACAVFFVYRKYGQKQPATVTAAPVMAPHIRTRQELDTLLHKRLLETGDIKAFYFEFSAIMRRYLEDIRGFPAAEYTIQEIAYQLHQKEDLELLALLRGGELVKFADYVPTREETGNLVQAAIDYILKTAPGQDLRGYFSESNGF